MPPRWFCAVIILAWLATTGWLIVDDLLPRLLPGTPPSFAIELTEEPGMERPWLFWTVTRDGKEMLRARTKVQRVGRDEYELSARYEPSEKESLVPMSGVLVRRMASSYRVTKEGDRLLGVSVEIDGKPDLADWLRVVNADFTATITGDVDAGRMAPELKLRAAALERTIRLPEVAVPRGGAVLLPLHPLNRLRNLRPGQAWTTRLVDPVADSLSALQGLGGEPRLLRARIRPEPEALAEGTRVGEPCLVIDYAGEGFKGATWVSRKSELVMMQEATLGKVRWAMLRD
jgi:hypothetical protein